jgi:hypothetical protein
MVSPETAGALLPRLFCRLVGSLFEIACSLAELATVVVLTSRTVATIFGVVGAARVAVIPP